MAEDQSTIEESKAFATGWFRGAEIVARYMKHRYPLIDGAIIRSQTGHRDACLKGLWMRAYVWMQTLARLNDPLDFQAVSAGNRALLEIAVDLVLLHHDKTNESGWRMHWWGVSEKLKASEQILDFYKTKNLALPDRYAPQKQFYDGEHANVLRMSRTLAQHEKPEPTPYSLDP